MTERIFSLERAKRGAKIGALTGVGAATSFMAMAAIGTALDNPARLINEVGDLVKVGAYLETASLLAFTPAGAIIDGFRPTSRFIEKKINEAFGDFKKEKDEMSEFWQRLKHDRRLAGRVLIFGGAGGIAYLGFRALKESFRPTMEHLLDEGIKNPSNFSNYLSEHMTEVGLGAGAMATYIGLRVYIDKKLMKTKKETNKTQEENNSP